VQNADIEPQDIQWQWKKVNRITTKNLISQISKFVARKDIERSEIIDFNNVKLFPMIKKGQWVALKMQHKGILIETKAKALNDGYLGKKLDVILEKGQTMLAAKVVEKGVVSVSY
jgi:flagella basal body P-ring formation protein FlgA